MNISIYDYEEYQSFLKDVSEGNGKPMSLSQWSKKLGYSSHRTIAMVINGERLPSLDMIDRLSKHLSLSQRQKRYFELLVLRKRQAKDQERISEINAQLESLRKERQHVQVEDDKWDRIFKWYFFPIKQLTGLKNFHRSSNWIRRKLRNKVTNIEIDQALSLMIHLGILKAGADENTLTDGGVDIFTKSDVPCQALQRHHSSMMERAKEALLEQPVEHREFRGVTLQFEKSKMKEAKLAIFDFLSHFNDKFSSVEGESVYQLSLQFFEHTDGRGRT